MESLFITAQNALKTDNLNGSARTVSELRAIGLSSFIPLGFPLPRTEAWKYTPIRKWLGDDFIFFADSDTENIRLPSLIESTASYIAVCVNGVFKPELSHLPDENAPVTISSLETALKKDPDLVSKYLQQTNEGAGNSFSFLNLAFLENGLFIHVHAEGVLDHPLYITDILSGPPSFFHQPRILVVADHHAKATIVEFRDRPGPADAENKSVVVSENQAFENTVTQVRVSDSADIDYYSLFDRGAGARFVRTLNVYQERDSTFATNEISLSGDLLRCNLNFLPDGEGCQTHLNGFYLAGAGMHVDMHTLVDHAKPQCVSNELFKGIIDGDATAVFNGRVLVRQDAQQINAYQSNRNVVLSDKAHMYSKPELEIYADDVKCSHGATTGQLDDDAIFYLRSRGIPREKARHMMLKAFSSDVFNLIRIEELRVDLEARVERILSESNM